MTKTDQYDIEIATKNAVRAAATVVRGNLALTDRDAIAVFHESGNLCGVLDPDEERENHTLTLLSDLDKYCEALVNILRFAAKRLGALENAPDYFLLSRTGSQIDLSSEQVGMLTLTGTDLAT